MAIDNIAVFVKTFTFAAYGYTDYLVSCYVFMKPYIDKHEHVIVLTRDGNYWLAAANENFEISKNFGNTPSLGMSRTHGRDPHDIVKDKTGYYVAKNSLEYNQLTQC